MEPDEHIETHPSAEEPYPRPRRRRFAWWQYALVALVLFFAFGWLLDYVTASPSLCTSCHEMEVRAGSWAESAHAHVKCVECHQEPHPWYAVPARLVGRGGILVRDISAHLGGEFADPVDVSSADASPITDAVCLQCHDPSRQATSGFRIQIDHAEHARRNGSCVSCHVRTAHPVETRGRALSLMAQCFTCHGSAEEPDASTECTVCHPTDYELIPVAHREPDWMQVHGPTSIEDPSLCTMCHEQPFCDDCHGLQMPHPEDWAKGATGHGVVAQTDRAVCTQCHGDRLDMCTMCHHSDYTPERGTWVQQHFLSVRERGATYCMTECHLPLFCVDCHVSPEFESP